MLAKVVQQLSQFALETISTLGYPGIVAVMALENVFPPIPSEVVMPFAGFLVTEGRFQLFTAIVMGTIGSLLGAVFWYLFGAWGNEIVVRNFLRHYGKFLFISENDLDRALEYFEKRGEIIIFTGRLIPIIRSLISIPAGLSRMEWKKFLFFTTLGTSIWTTILTVAGKILGENWPRVGEWLEKYEHLVLGLLVTGLAYFIYHQFRVRKRPSAQE